MKVNLDKRENKRKPKKSLKRNCEESEQDLAEGWRSLLLRRLEENQQTTDT